MDSIKDKTRQKMVLECNDPKSLDNCHENYLINAWTDFNQTLLTFQEQCQNNCDFAKMIPAYQILQTKIEEVLKAISTLPPNKNGDNSSSKTIKMVIDLKKEIDAKLKEIEIDMTTTNQSVSSQYQLKYEGTLYVHFLWVLILIFICSAFISFLIYNYYNN
jgi:hypothetical protein